MPVKTKIEPFRYSFSSLPVNIHWSSNNISKKGSWAKPRIPACMHVFVKTMMFVKEMKRHYNRMSLQEPGNHWLLKEMRRSLVKNLQFEGPVLAVIQVGSVVNPRISQGDMSVPSKASTALTRSCKHAATATESCLETFDIGR